jgi:hypothetical protein
MFRKATSGYPEPFREGQRKRYNSRLGDHQAGLKNYGVNLIRVLPGGQSSARHAHFKQDYVLGGELVLVTDAGRETVRLSSRNRRRLSFLNLTQNDAVFLHGDRTALNEYRPLFNFLFDL